MNKEETATALTTTASATTGAVGESQLPFHSGGESDGDDDSRDIVALARDTGDAAFLQKSSTGIQ